MAMQKITLPPEQRAAILRRAQSRPHRLRRTAGRAVLAAVLVVLLTFSAFAAASPALREALQHVLGGFTEQSQPITGVAVEENGIEVRPVAALSDSGMTKVYIEIQDKTGSRLDGSYDVAIEIAHPIDDGPVHLSTNSRQISYDAESNTALYEAQRPDSIAADNPTAAIRVFLLDPQAAPGEETIGSWSFEIDLERVIERHFTPDATINGYRLFEVRISSISLTVWVENGVTDPTQPDYNRIEYAYMPVTLTMRDGTVIHVTEKEENRILAADSPPSADPQEEYEGYYHSEVQWMFEQPVDPDAVTAITIDGVDVPLQ